MAYWWVSQNQTYRHERSGEYLWAPNIDRRGVTPFHWSTMNKVEQGDVIFSYVDQKIVSISIAKTKAYDSPRPKEFRSQISFVASIRNSPIAKRIIIIVKIIPKNKRIDLLFLNLLMFHISV